MSDTRQVVPKEPTPEMDDAGKAALVQLGIYSTSYAGVVWRAMYDAAPVPAPPAEPTRECELLAWAYSKLHRINFSAMDDALALDEIKLLLDAAPAAEPVAQPAEPVAWMMPIGDRGLIEWGAARPCYPVDANAWQPLYAAPAAEPEREQGDPRDDRSYTGQIAALKRALRDVMRESDRDTDAYIRARAPLSAP